MDRTMKTIAGWAVAVLIGLACAGSATGFEADFYVATDGRDIANGRKPQAGGEDGPFASLDRARRAVRELKQADPKRERPIVVAVRGGLYAMAQTLTLEPADSGTEKAPVVYQAFPGEEPILSGGTVIQGWTVRDGRWEVKLNQVAEGKWYFEQLYVNDQRRYRPVVPKDGYFFVQGSVGPSSGESMNRFRYAEGDLKADWRNLSDTQVHAFHAWSTSRLPIRSIDPATRVVTLSGSTWNVQHAALKEGSWYRVENVAEELDEPGEWYLDRASGVLTYLPCPGESPETARVVAPRLERLVHIKGDVGKGTFVEQIHFRGLTFAHGAWQIGKRGYTTFQAEVILDGAITAENARQCLFEDCVVRHTGAYGIDLGAGCRDIRVERCEFVDLGAGGVKIGTGQFNKFDDPKKLTEGCTVRDCLVAHGGRIHPGGVGLWIGHAGHNTLEHNEVRDLYYSAVSAGWMWSPGASPATHNTIAWNHLHHLGHGAMSDLAGIYTLGESPGTVEHHNLIHDVTRARYGGWGIYFDESSSDIVVENNLVYRTEDAPFHLHHGRRLTVRNNIFAFGRNDQIKLTNMKKSGTLHIEGNLWYWKEGELFKGAPDEEITFARNLYWKIGGGAFTFAGGTDAEKWKAKEKDFLVADPLFVDPENGDFTLKSGSPAQKIGFKPFDLSSAGRITKTNRTAGLPVVKGPFPPAPLEPPIVFDQDFELLKVGQGLPGFDQQAASSEENAIVTDECAASGKKCLKFRDGPGGAVYFPHLYRYLKYDAGKVVSSLDLRIEARSKLTFEWRDANPWYKAGPSISVEDGVLKASGRKLVDVTPGAWLNIRIVCGVGPEATGTYEVTLTPQGGEAKTFTDLKYASGFKTLGWIGFASNSKEKVAYWIDNLKLQPTK